MKLFTVSTNRKHALGRAFNRLATYSAAAVLGATGTALLTPQPALAQQRVDQAEVNHQVIEQQSAAANVADVAQLLETGFCRGCNLTGADLTGEHLIGVDLRGANLTDAVLSGANLEGADLTGATLINTDLSGAFLTHTLLDESVISNVNFSEATLIYTSLEGAEINDVDLLNAQVINTPISVGGSYDQ
ncbi:pentapeptide repeat-containing protein [cf. Phormidesmis sp. LEGE 11477]|uniref:pentapeptide repeat-containing protein n=1 Tax=cf. Phormidesmis sp. LEGE 11477 TaxID=1828680 RepID=UPI0018806E43|nr:pentapeptide repeat-containing protein [cf. Phormidesmis sp. LEGE 11477]MBE9064683.1 pentapeptide repeat-containing protein [cf. Phormidesmis sp. LEGE 11477]